MLRSKTLPSSSLRTRSLTAPSPPAPPPPKPGSKGPCSQARAPPQPSPPATSSVRDLAGKLESPFPRLFQLFPQLSQRDLGSRLELLYPSPAIPSGRDLAIWLEPTSPSPGTFFPPTLYYQWATKMEV